MSDLFSGGGIQIRLVVSLRKRSISVLEKSGRRNATDGISAIDMIGNATEVFRIQIALGRSKLLQGFVLLLRLLRAR